MTEIFLDYEWFINLVAMAIFTALLLAPERTIIKYVSLQILFTAAYLTLLASVIINGVIKGF